MGRANADEIAHAAMEHYSALPAKGKPTGPHEWTVMAAFVLENTVTCTLQVRDAWYMGAYSALPTLLEGALF